MTRKERIKQIKILEQQIIDQCGIDSLYNVRKLYLRDSSLLDSFVNLDLDLFDKEARDLKCNSRMYLDYLKTYTVI